MELLEDSKAKHLAGSTRKERTVREAILEQYLEVEPERLEHGLVKVKRQLPTAVGPIDILAKDKKGAHVVIELKKGRTSDRVLGQILRYMAWVGENLRNKKPVRGIIVAEKADKGLKYAMRVARKSGIGLKRYQFEINFWDV
ncbi:MAG: endonuclease NucS, partial [Nitrososphaera sp.]|nr:endonuclease NucS [Nitrososphaera sp.]